MPELTHFDAEGNARMVDIGDKQITRRSAAARGSITMRRSTLKLIADGKLAKGDVLGTARLAGIMGTKLTASLIPLCHSIGVDSVDIGFELVDGPAHNDSELRISARVASTGRTGVEMEALTAVTTAALTVYDMCKSVDREMTIRDVLLLEKTGGRSGHFVRSSGQSKE